ncbi:MAG: hypothetical protein IH840_01600 [Candidatus Heimdallarchaeota archaeon]|nr:hypothetical protein [Candidatus Heimdallarchaeota archaeon]
MTGNCPTCENPTQANWKYCRFCGSLLEKEVEEDIEEEESVDESIEELEAAEEVVPSSPFDQDLYFSVFVSRSERNRISRQKSALKSEIGALRQQWNSDLISADYMKENMGRIKVEVSALVEKEKKFGDLPEELPIEILVDEINAVKRRIKKIEKLQKDETLSKDGIRDAVQRAKSSMGLLRDEHSKLVGHIRIWQGGLKDDLRDARGDLEQLNIRFRIEEITEESFKERKEALVKKIEDLDNVLTTTKKVVEI